MMDPIFGLPCINETRAMDNARNRNYIAEKNLIKKFESLDLARKTKSGKLLNSKSSVGDFFESLDLSTSKSQRRRHHDKNIVRSMSLRELDKLIIEAKDRKAYVQSTPIQTKKLTTSAKASNPKSTILLKREPTVVLNTFDSDSSHIVHLDKHERCLPINRQKHAMRDAYERATTEDLFYKKQRALSGLSPRSFSPQRGHDNISMPSFESHIHSKLSHIKDRHERKKPKS